MPSENDIAPVQEGSHESNGAEEEGAPNQDASSPPYTIFRRGDKQLLTLLLGLATVTSPLTATIYFPLLPLLERHFVTSAQAIHWTITLYVIFQAISPAVFAPLSDSFGRRPVYLLTLSLYVLANLGLSLNKHSYGVLLGLRAVQSLGASAAFAVSYGVVADVCVPSERGSMLGPVSMALNLGACVGPVVGGWVAYKSGGYEWVFWALVIVGVTLLSSVLILLPETARSLVGNASGEDQLKWWEKPLSSLLVQCFKPGSRSKTGPKPPATSRRRRSYRVQSPLASIRIIFYPDAFLCLYLHGSFYVVDYSLATAIPAIYTSVYHFNALDVGLAYLPRGVGIIIGGFLNGKLMDHNYRVTARSIGFVVDRVHGDDLVEFPIERARSRGAYCLLLIAVATLVGYGWAVHQHLHFSVLLVLQFVQGVWGTMGYTIFNTLLVDAFPGSPSTAAAAASIVRCSMAAAAVAILQPLLDAAGRGWYFTALGLWMGGLGACSIWTIRAKGWKWRKNRAANLKGEKEETLPRADLRPPAASSSHKENYSETSERDTK